MSIDLAQFHHIFFEESFEGLAAMETGLLNLDPDSIDRDEINNIFRAAHSIKGGSGTFGFSQVTDFTHVLETLLDEMRSGERAYSQGLVNILLQSVDCLREMLTALQNDTPCDGERVDDHFELLNQQLAGRDIGAENQSAMDTAQSQEDANLPPQQISGWRIRFRPHTHLMKLGNEPLRILRELQHLGVLTVVANLETLPSFKELDPAKCYLAWDINLAAAVDREKIDEIFEWVLDDCELDIQPVHSDLWTLSNRQNCDSNFVLAHPIVSERESDAPQADILKTQSVVAKSNTRPKNPTSSCSSSIRVATSKIDKLVDMVGELVITQSMLNTLVDQFEVQKLDQLRNGLIQLQRHTHELQESVMNIRMMPISFVFNRFPRLVHDLSETLGKQAELQVSGENTEVDKSVVELIGDPLLHLLRNSLDHGIESPEHRIAAGKPAIGCVQLDAFHRGGNIHIEVSDDGNGLDPKKLKDIAVQRGMIDADVELTEHQAYELIMLPGFSSAKTVSDVSGRGVGMDVVRENIKSLGGAIEIRSVLGKGSTFSISLPLTLAILDGQLVTVGDETYVIPLAAIVESICVSDSTIFSVTGRAETFKLHGKYIPIVRLHEAFDIPNPRATDLTEGLVVVVEGKGTRIGLFVDDLLGQQQVVIKSLEANYRRIPGVSGATILGNGSVALILDVPGLIRLSVDPYFNAAIAV